MIMTSFLITLFFFPQPGAYEIFMTHTPMDIAAFALPLLLTGADGREGGRLVQAAA
jgi:hypothetical protein